MTTVGQSEGRLNKNRGVDLGGKGGPHDALIATTASVEADVLVTDDGQLIKKMRMNGEKYEVWTFSSSFRS
jgi:predicted nucleic acid-binding protein